MAADQPVAPAQQKSVWLLGFRVSVCPSVHSWEGDPQRGSLQASLCRFPRRGVAVQILVAPADIQKPAGRLLIGQEAHPSSSELVQFPTTKPSFIYFICQVTSSKCLFHILAPPLGKHATRIRTAHRCLKPCPLAPCCHPLIHRLCHILPASAHRTNASLFPVL